MRENLRVRKSPPKPSSQPSGTPKKKAKSAAQKQKEYRERLRVGNPEKYKQTLEEQKRRSEINRIDIQLLPDDDEKKQRAKELNKARVRKYREKKKVEAQSVAATTTKSKALTRAETEKLELKKKNDRERKQKERSLWSRQKRAAVNQKARERRLAKKLVKEVAAEPLCGHNVNGETNGETKGSRKQRLYRVRKALPKDPTKRQVTLADLLNGQRAKESDAEILLKGIARSKQGRAILKQNLSDKSLRVRSLCRKYLSMSRQLAYYHMKVAQHKKPSVSAKKRKTIEAYIIEHSQPMGGKKSMYRGVPKRLLHRTITDLHASFQKEHFPVSLSFLCKVRRCMRFCVSAAKQAYNQTLCELCENTRLKLKALSSATSFPLTDVSNFIDRFTCPRQGMFHRDECIEGTCSLCPKMNILQDTEAEKRVVFQEWLNVSIDGKKKKTRQEKGSTAGEIINGLAESLVSFRQHLHVARWQYHQFLSIKRDLKDGDLLMVMDFAENYRCAHQDEVQSAYWSYEQVTIHPMVCYYICTKCQVLTTESVVAISDDLLHDSHAVEEFFQRALAHFQDRGVAVKQVLQFTDGCGAQYKSKVPFGKIASQKACPLERHYFGTGHGKNPSDGESAVIKTKAARSVKCRQTAIQGAEDLYKFCKDSLTKEATLKGYCNHFRRTFIFVPSGVIKRQSANVQTIKGTRKVHCIKAAGDGVGVWTKNLNCHCELGNAACEGHFPEEWKYHKVIIKENKVNSEGSEAQETTPPDQDLQGDEALLEITNTSVCDTSTEINNPDISDILSTSQLEHVQHEIGIDVPKRKKCGKKRKKEKSFHNR